VCVWMDGWMDIYVLVSTFRNLLLHNDSRQKKETENST